MRNKALIGILGVALGVGCAAVADKRLGKPQNHRILWPESALIYGEEIKGLEEKAGEITLPCYVVHRDGDSEKLVGLGNGFVIGDKYITAKHVRDAAIKVYGSELYVNGIKLELIGESEEEDVVVLRLPKSLDNIMNDYSINFSSAIYSGQRIAFYGSPSGYFFSNSEGLLERGVVRIPNYSFSREGDSIQRRDFVFFDGTLVIGGDSGSPVFDANTGDVIGIVTDGNRNDNGLPVKYGIFTRIANCERFMGE